MSSSRSLNRRAFIGTSAAGLAGAAIGLRHLNAGMMIAPGGMMGFNQYRPVRSIPQSEMDSSVHIAGLPFLPHFIGDYFPSSGEMGEDLPFHHDERGWRDGREPAIDEQVSAVVVGGGLGGLTAAWELREMRPIVLEMRDRFGGNAMGESWRGATTSLGSVYVITPDPGPLMTLYTELGMDKAYRFEDGAMHVEWNREQGTDLCSLANCTPAEQKAMARYLEQVEYRADGGYPNIPLTGSPLGDQMVRELDTRSFADDIRNESGPNLPPILQQAIQAYCYSSFGIGWEEISAAGGWNFLAAEEFGRWILPGGNSYMADALWRRLRAVEQNGGEDGSMLRGNSPAVDIKELEHGKWKVSYRTPDGGFRAIQTDNLVMANSKHVAKYLINDLEGLDPEKSEALNEIRTMPYIVVNILLRNRPEKIPYDLFLLGQGDLPMTPDAFQANSRPVDVLDGDYASGPLKYETSQGASLQLFWPLPWHTARFSLVTESAFEEYAAKAAEQIHSLLPRLGISVSDIAQIRMVRWAHAMPIPVPGLIADGTCEMIRRPIGSMYFANQDNWALPAVENTVLDAIEFSQSILGG